MTVSTEVLAVLADVLQTREVYDAPDLPLYELDLLDSLRTVELILALSEILANPSGPEPACSTTSCATCRPSTDTPDY